MVRQFKVCAEVHLGSYKQWDCNDCNGLDPDQRVLPIHIGAYRLDWSPNAGIYFSDVFGIDPEITGDQSVDHDFPISALMVEMEGEIPERSSAAKVADGELEAFELLLRLFQPGDVSVRRHDFVHNAETGAIWISWIGDRAKPIVEPLYERPPYHIHYDTIWALLGFFKKYHHVVPQMPSSVKRAFARFNTSYERRDVVDRLIDLIIALEALFNDGNPSGVTFKVALRCAFWLKPPGNEREKLFRTVKKAYSSRSDTVHARQGSPLNEKELEELVEELEDVVRDSLMKYLDLQILTGNIQVGNDFDHLILTGRI